MSPAKLDEKRPARSGETQPTQKTSAFPPHHPTPNQALPAWRKLRCVLRWAFRPRNRMKNAPLAARRNPGRAPHFRPDTPLQTGAFTWRKLRCVSQWFRCPAVRYPGFWTRPSGFAALPSDTLALRPFPNGFALSKLNQLRSPNTPISRHQRNLISQTGRANNLIRRIRMKIQISQILAN